MGRVLSSWKDIAGFLGKGVRTVQRWEKELQLPVRRPARGIRNVVFADSDELASWAIRRMARHNGVTSVLLVESDRATRHFLRSCLEHSGYFVLCCSNDNEAWFVFEEGPPFSVLVFGFQVGDQRALDLPLQFAKRRSRMPAILVASSPALDGTFEKVENTRWTVLTQPLEPSVFLRAVESALDRKVSHPGPTEQADLGAGIARTESNAS